MFKRLFNFNAGKLLLLAIPFTFAGCSQGEPPSAPLSISNPSESTPTPAPVAPVAAEQQAKQPAVATVFNRGGVEVESEEINLAMKECLKEGFYFDRSINLCSKVPLADIHCTLDGVKLELAELGATSSFETLIAGPDFADLKLDQCIRCAEGNSENICKNVNTGAFNVGVSLLFINPKDAAQFRSLVVNGLIR